MLELESVLPSSYGCSKVGFVRFVASLFSAAELRFEWKRAPAVALQMYRDGSADFADCVHVAPAARAAEQSLWTFDRRGAQIQGGRGCWRADGAASQRRSSRHKRDSVRARRRRCRGPLVKPHPACAGPMYALSAESAVGHAGPSDRSSRCHRRCPLSPQRTRVRSERDGRGGRARTRLGLRTAIAAARSPRPGRHQPGRSRLIHAGKRQLGTTVDQPMRDADSGHALPWQQAVRHPEPQGDVEHVLP